MTVPARVTALAAIFALGIAAGCSSGSTEATDGSVAVSSPRAADGITVAAAADLRPAFAELGAAFEARTGTKVTLSFGSSGQLAEQIINGAPFDLFASASVNFVDEVVAAGKADRSTRATYGFGRIVVYSPEDGPGAITTLDALGADRVRFVAIANPEHAPYGAAAEQALRAAGVFDTVRPKLVYGENVSDALRLVTTRNADAGIVALSLVIAGDRGTWALVDESRHDPLEQALVVTADSPGTRIAARAFARYVGSAPGRAVMNRFGFVLPGERAG